MKTITLAVEGMMCGHCESRVHDALQSVDGVKESNASAKAAQVSCTFDEALTNEEAIAEAIEAVGYDVNKQGNL